MDRLDASITAYIDDCMEHRYSNSYLISVLHKIQGKHGYLSEAHMNEVAERMQIPSSTVSGVATFYHFFRLEPRGKYAISLCLGTACFVKGADKVLDAFRTELGIGLGETTEDRLFSLESSRCIGVCALAPVVMINDRVYSRVSPNQVPTMISDIRAAQ
jgi:NADH:ubiquinone oxidoreductase subunit E